jgi:hypothetical protein
LMMTMRVNVADFFSKGGRMHIGLFYTTFVAAKRSTSVIIAATSSLVKS